MKRVALITNTSWNIINFRSSLVNDLKTEFDVVLIAPKDKHSSEVEKLATTYYIDHLSRKGTNPIKDLLLVNELRKLYKKLGIDLALHFTIKPNIYGSFAAKLAKIPSIAVVTGLGYTFLSNGIAAKAAKLLYKQAFQCNSLTIFQNPDDQSLFLKKELVPVDKSTVILGSGIDTEQFSPQQKTDNHQGFHFLFIGRMLYDKGVRELLSAFSTNFKNNNHIYLHLVGDIDNENPSAFSELELNKSIESSNNIIYHGRINDPRDMIANSDCVVLPSYREGLPRVMLEALSMAKPVLTTNVPGCRETVHQNKNGFLFQAKNTTDLAQKMTKISQLSDEQLILMGNHGRSLALKKFSTKVINKKYIHLIRSLI